MHAADLSLNFELQFNTGTACWLEFINQQVPYTRMYTASIQPHGLTLSIDTPSVSRDPLKMPGGPGNRLEASYYNSTMTCTYLSI